MTGPARRARRGSVALPIGLACLVVGTIIGLVFMHALSGGHELLLPPGMPAHAATSPVADPCHDSDRRGHCPTDQPRHPGPMCQSTPATAGAVIPALVRSPVPVAALPTALLRDTAAGEVGAGSGCGPPSLTMLSISRT